MYIFSFYRVKFQARGLPHIHGVCWIEKEELLQRGIDGDLTENEDAAIKLADELVSCKLPQENDELSKIVSEVQIHKHTKSCMKYNGTCCYGFPRLPSPVTLLAKPLELIDPTLSEKEMAEKKAKASKILRAAKSFLENHNFDENMTLHDFYLAIDTNEADYVDALKITDRGKVLILKREVRERFVNNYNPEMLLAWNANMDLQFVFDPYAVVSYIASYMNKDETQTTPFLREALHASAGKEAREKLKALKDAYLSHRQVGLSEAVYEVNPSLRMKDSNISCLFVMTGFPKNRSVF